MKKPIQTILFTILLGFAVIGVFIYLIPQIKILNFERFLRKIQTREELKGATLVADARYEGEKNSFLSFHSEKRIHPGSNFKLFTASAALSLLGTDFTFSTRLYKDSRGNIIFKGSGDPTFELEDIKEFVAAVKKSGKITGDIYYDDSAFTGEMYGPGWGQDILDLYYAAPITALQINDNLLDIRGIENKNIHHFEITTTPLENYQPILDERTARSSPNELLIPITASINSKGAILLKGDTLKNLPFLTSATIKDPNKFTAQVLKQELLKAGLINPDAMVIHQDAKEESRAIVPENLLYEHKSKPLSDIVYRMLKFSKNNYAETLVRTMGKEIAGEGTQAKGVDVLRNFVHDIGIPDTEFLPFDGSGLSPSTRLTSGAILTLFEYINTQPWSDVFWTALPESKVDGTLKNRFENAGLTNKVIAKTGTHDFSSSLSGKIFRDGQKTIEFSVHIYNHPFNSEESIQNILPTIDTIIALLDKQF